VNLSPRATWLIVGGVALVLAIVAYRAFKIASAKTAPVTGNPWGTYPAF
jgi:hypothetical protein